MSFFHRRESRKSISDLDPHQWDLSYSTTSWKPSKLSKHPKTVVPDPAIFRDAIVPSVEQIERGSTTSYPNPGHLAVHLLLIECFLKLKQSATTAPELTILDAPKYPGDPAQGKTAGPPETSQAAERWKTVVRLAVSRFQVWFENIESLLTHAAAYHRYGSNSTAAHAAITPDYLPPLDVLLVWYVYMNHPGAYHDDNLAHSSPKLLKVPFPWEAILAVIDTSSLTYTIPPAAQRLFTTTTTQSHDILIYLNHPPPYSELVPENAFSLDLASAVHFLVDGTSFMENMHALLWLRSPSLEGTLGRGLAQYNALPQATGCRASAFLSRVRDDPAFELVWRTYILYPVAYETFSNRVFGSDILLRSPAVYSGHEEEETYDDIKATEGLDGTLTNQSSASDEGTLCYCWTCQRIMDEDPEYLYIPTTSTEAPPPSFESPEEEGRSPIRRRNSIFPRTQSSELPPSSPSGSQAPLCNLTKEQISEIKSDVAFHRHVEAFRQSNPPGTPLPTRPPTTRALERQKQEQESKDRAGKFYGIGYTVEVIRPAVYDETTGRLLRKEKTRVKRSKYMKSLGPWGGPFVAL